jgi:hypothetical protein
MREIDTDSVLVNSQTENIKGWGNAKFKGMPLGPGPICDSFNISKKAIHARKGSDIMKVRYPKLPFIRQHSGPTGTLSRSIGDMEMTGAVRFPSSQCGHKRLVRLSSGQPIERPDSSPEKNERNARPTEITAPRMEGLHLRVRITPKVVLIMTDITFVKWRQFFISYHCV